MNLLFLCTGNSARSILGEAIANHVAQGKIRAWSAGSHPKGVPHPLALETLQAQGVAVGGLASKHWDDAAILAVPGFDVVITVCDAAAGEVCPVWPGAPARVHWGLPDPPAAGDEAAQRALFRQVYSVLFQRLSAFVALPLVEMTPVQAAAYLTRIEEEFPCRSVLHAG